MIAVTIPEDFDDLLCAIHDTSPGMSVITINDKRLADLMVSKGLISQNSRGSYAQTNLFDYMWQVAERDSSINYVEFFKKHILS